MNTKNMTMEYRLKHWTSIIKECKESGLSVRAYCESAGIHENRYYYWQKKLREKLCEELVKKNNKETGMIPAGFTEVKLSDGRISTNFHTTGNSNDINIEVSGMRIIAGVDYPTAKLVELLREMRLP